MPRGDGRSASKGIQAFSELSVETRETLSEVENLKKKLEERKVNHKLLWNKFIKQGLLLKNIENKKNQLAKNGAKIIIQACKVAFFTGFKKHRTIVRAHFSSNPVEPLQTDYLDGSLMVVVADSAERFAREFHFPTELSNFDAAVQIEGIVGAEEYYLTDDRPDNPPEE